MKQIVVHICEFTAAAMVFLFCIRLIMTPDGTVSAFAMASAIAEKYQMQEVLSENGVRMENVINRAAPELECHKLVWETGKRLEFWSLVQVRTKEEPDWKPIQECEAVTYEVLDIADNKGSSLGKAVFEADHQISDEVAEPVSCRRETGEIYFFQSGIYRVKIKVVDVYGRSVIKQMAIPVEVRIETS